MPMAAPRPDSPTWEDTGASHAIRDRFLRDVKCVRDSVTAIERHDRGDGFASTRTPQQCRMNSPMKRSTFFPDT